MDNTNHTKTWRVINMILIVLGLSTPWFRLYFDTLNPPSPIGWIVIIANFQEIGNHLSTYGFEVYMLPVLLTELGGVLLIAYFILNLFSIIGNKDRKSNRLISVILVGIIISLSFPVFIGAEPLLGYWLITAGVLSSAILEWKRVQKTNSQTAY